LPDTRQEEWGFDEMCSVAGSSLASSLEQTYHLMAYEGLKDGEFGCWLEEMFCLSISVGLVR